MLIKELQTIKFFLISNNLNLPSHGYLHNLLTNVKPNQGLGEIKDIKSLELELNKLDSFEAKESFGSFYTPNSIVNQMILDVSPSYHDLCLDPSIGLGAFTIPLIDYFKSVHKKNIKKILRENIRANDIQERSLILAKALISIYALYNGEILEEDDFYFELGDSLISSKDISYDIILGNPPYLSLENKDLSASIDVYRNKYKSIYKVYDLFGLFIEFGINKLSQNGKLSYIVPTTLFVNDSFIKLRKIMVSAGITRLTDYGDGVFKDAVVPTCSFVIEKNNKNENIDVIKNNILKKLKFENVLMDDFSFNLEPDVYIENLLLKSNLKNKLSDLIDISECIKTRNDIECISEKRDFGFLPVFKGRDVTAFNSTVRRYINPSLIKNKAYKIGNLLGDKLLIRRVSSELVCCIDRQNIYAVHTLYSAKVRPGINPLVIESLEVILNSTLWTRMYRSKNPFKGKIFPEIRIGKLGLLPIFSEEKLLEMRDDLTQLKKSILKDRSNTKELDIYLEREMKIKEEELIFA